MENKKISDFEAARDAAAARHRGQDTGDAIEDQMFSFRAGADFGYSKGRTFERERAKALVEALIEISAMSDPTGDNSTTIKFVECRGIARLALKAYGGQREHE